MQMWWLSSETEEKDDRIQQMFKQIEVKNMEAQRYKTAAEVAKVSPTIQTLAADYRVIHGTFTSLQIFDMSFNEFIAFVHSVRILLMRRSRCAVTSSEVGGGGGLAARAVRGEGRADSRDEARDRSSAARPRRGGRRQQAQVAAALQRRQREQRTYMYM